MNSSALRKTFLALAAITAIAAIVPARAAQFGQLNGGTPSSGLSGDYKRGSKVTLAEPGVLTRLEAKLDGLGGPQSGVQAVTMLVYADNNGVPGIKLAESDRRFIRALDQPENIEFFLQPIPLPAGTYWLVLHSGGSSVNSTPGIIRDYGISAPANTWYANADLLSDTATSPFGAGSSGPTQLMVAGDYLPPAEGKFAGRGTVAATPSGGLSSNFKRGSRFTLTEAGRVFELTAYLDAKPGSAGSQKLRYALYRDSGGQPSTLVAESDEVTVSAGQWGKWVSSPIVPMDLPAGNYWVVIHTGDTAGIARDYGDGAANWYSAADTYADGASANFGTGTTGTVTISAAALYFPGPSVTRTIGRTTVAATPSGGLSTNFQRGSLFSGFNPGTYTSITAFWAYLDGNGGGSGSQQVRVAMYGDSGTSSEVPYSKIVESDTVTIPAGMTPQWVRFPLKAPARLDEWPGLFISLQSGDTNSVVRDYGDGDANWIGVPDTYADGAVSYFYPGGLSKTPGVTYGTVTLSIYVEYTVPPNSP